MDIQGRIVQILPEVEGVSKSGNSWRKQEFILQTKSGNYDRNVCITLFGDRVDQFQIAEGDEVRVGVDIESREFNGRWYTNVNGYRIDKIQLQNASDPNFAPNAPQPQAPTDQGYAQNYGNQGGNFANPATAGYNQMPQSTDQNQFPQQEGDDLPF